MTSNTTTKLSSILDKFSNVTASGDEYSALCPAHDDRTSSLSIAEKSGKILIHCHAGCTAEAVVDAVGLKMSDLSPQPSKKSEPTQTYDYTDEEGKLLFQVCRFDPKDFRQRKPDGNGGWLWKVEDVRKVLYRLPELLATDQTTPVFLVEGEKDADRLAKLGFMATTNSGGAKKWRHEYSESLNKRRVVIIPDNDDVGRRHAQDIAKALCKTAAGIRIVELPGLPKKGDVSDWLNSGGTADELKQLMKATENWVPGQEIDDDADGRPKITITTDEHKVNDAVLEALRDDTTIFKRGGKLVRIVQDDTSLEGIKRPPNAPHIAALPTSFLRNQMTKHMRFVDDIGLKRPPAWCVNAIHTAALMSLIDAMAEIDPERHGRTASQLSSLVEQVRRDENMCGNEDGAIRQLSDALLELCSTRTGSPSAHTVGNALRRVRGRVCSGQAVDYRETGGRTRLWIVKTVE
jgi:hypothetical protein